MSDARRYAVWPEPRSRSLKGSRPSVPHGTNFVNLHYIYSIDRIKTLVLLNAVRGHGKSWKTPQKVVESRGNPPEMLCTNLMRTALAYTAIFSCTPL